MAKKRNKKSEKSALLGSLDRLGGKKKKLTQHLLGLLFVVITLAAERGRKDTPSMRTYLTPAVIYFSSLLLMSAVHSHRIHLAQKLGTNWEQ